MINHPNLFPIFRQTRRELFEKLGKEQLTPAMVLCPGVSRRANRVFQVCEPKWGFTNRNHNKSAKTNSVRAKIQQVLVNN
jgi:hypothetical protein